MLNAIIDISHHNKITSFSKIKTAGIYGIIHKATQGTRYKDPTFIPNRSNAIKADLKVGAYHPKNLSWITKVCASPCHV